MLKFSKLVACALAIACASACEHDDVVKVVLRDRAQTEWISIAATKKLLEQGPLPAHWDAALFVDADAFTNLARRFEGLEARFDKNQGDLGEAFLTLTHFDIEPTLGALKGSISLAGKAKKLNAALAIKVEVIARYEGTVTDTDGSQRFAQFKWTPVSIQPSVDWGPLHARAKDLDGQLIALIAENFVKPDAFAFTLPVQQSLSAESGFAQPRKTRVPVPPNGWIDFSESMPEQKVDPGAANTAAIFANYGVWIVTQISKDDPLPPPPTIPNIPTEQLDTQIAAMRQAMAPALAKAQPTGGGVKAFIAKSAFSKLIAAVNAVPAEGKRVTIQATAHEGKLAEKTLHDNTLGSIGAFVELASDADTKASISLGTITGGWTANGLQLTVPIAAQMESSLHFHVIAPIGGGAGIVVGVKGDASQAISLSAKPVFVSDALVAAAALTPKAQCVQVPITVVTDGKLRVDLGWMSVPSVGVKTYLPAFNEDAPPESLFDSRPHFVNFVPQNTKAVSFMHPKPFGEIELVPTAIKTSNDGVEFGAKLIVADLTPPGAPDDAKAAEQLVQQDAGVVSRRVKTLLHASQESSTCTAPGNTELLIGDIAIGPNNEVVKFLTNAVNDLTNGPGDNNDVVKAGAYVGGVLKKLNPADPAVRGFLNSTEDAAKKAFGENSVAYALTASVNKDIQAFEDNPAKYVADMPAQTWKALGDMGSGTIEAVTKPQMKAQLGGGSITAGIGNTTITASLKDGFHGSVFGAHF